MLPAAGQTRWAPASQRRQAQRDGRPAAGLTRLALPDSTGLPPRGHPRIVKTSDIAILNGELDGPPIPAVTPGQRCVAQANALPILPNTGRGGR